MTAGKDELFSLNVVVLKLCLLLSRFFSGMDEKLVRPFMSDLS